MASLSGGHHARKVWVEHLAQLGMREGYEIEAQSAVFDPMRIAGMLESETFEFTATIASDDRHLDPSTL